MNVEFHAVDLNIKCISKEERLQGVSHTLVGARTINHGTIPVIGDMVMVDFLGETEVCKVLERAFDFKSNICQLWVELIDLDKPHDGTVKYQIKQ